MQPTLAIGEGYRPRTRYAKSGRKSTPGSQWILDADLKDFFGSAEQSKLLTLVSRRISDGRVLRLIESPRATQPSSARQYQHKRQWPRGSPLPARPPPRP
jgi:retron-type reverse transcriptase